jgi:hypothetical protein
MSTNGFISFIAQGEAKNAYNHWDSDLTTSVSRCFTGSGP